MDIESKKYSFLGLDIGRIGWWGSLLAFIATPALVLPYVLWFGAAHGRSLSDSPEQWAQFGDYLAGTAGPLIGFASIMLLVATLHLQRSELKEQREHLKVSTVEATNQNRIILRQSFEQSFFTWMRDYKEQINQVTIDPNEEVHFQPPHFSTYKQSTANHPSGGRALARIADLLGTYAHNELYKPLYLSPVVLRENKEQTVSIDDHTAAVARSWTAIRDDDSGPLRSAIRTLYALIRWIDRHESLTQDDKEHYTSIVKARLTETEMLILLANGLTTRGEKLYRLLVKYDMLSELRAEQFPVLRHINHKREEPTPQP